MHGLLWTTLLNVWEEACLRENLPIQDSFSLIMKKTWTSFLLYIIAKLDLWSLHYFLLNACLQKPPLQSAFSFENTKANLLDLIYYNKTFTSCTFRYQTTGKCFYKPATSRAHTYPTCPTSFYPSKKNRSNKTPISYFYEFCDPLNLSQTIWANDGGKHQSDTQVFFK